MTWLYAVTTALIAFEFLALGLDLGVAFLRNSTRGGASD